MVPVYPHQLSEENSRIIFPFTQLSTYIEDACPGKSELFVSSPTIEETPIPAGAPTEIQAIIDAISASSYSTIVNRLCNSFGNRLFGTDGNDKAVEYIAEYFEDAGLEVSFHEFGASGQNVVGTIPGANILNNECIVVGAHLDAVQGSPGADDNGSGVAAVMEIARAMAQYQYNYTIIFVAFNAEEQGLIGSKAFAGSLQLQNASVAIAYNFDMIMWNNPSAPSNRKVEIIHDGDISGVFANQAANIGHNWLNAPIQARFDPTMTSSDHYSFWSKNYPAIWFFEYEGGNNPYYHSIEDAPDATGYSYSQGAMVAKTAAAALADYAKIISTNPGFPSVSFVSPTPDEFLRPSDDIPILLSIEDDFNDVNLVELSFDNNPWVNITSGFNSTHCVYHWNASTAYGNYNIRARVIDDKGWVGSASVSFRVDFGVSCLITSPISDEAIAQGCQYIIWVNATDPDGGSIIYSLVRINGSSWLGMQVSIPNHRYYYSWTVSGWGPVAIEVRVADSNGNSNQSLVYATVVRYTPIVSNVYFTPLQPLDTEEVQITADVTQDSRGSGINMVLVYYSIEYSLWKTRRLTLVEGNMWSVFLDPLPAGSRVRFYISAYDNLGNIGRDDNNGTYYNFTVNSNLFPLLAIGGGLAGIAGIGIGFYMIRRKRRLRPTPPT
ncbi:MAG: M28 family metallopeptidase [Promethearchaeota archaeon]